jgi:hypothetical protein
LEIGTITDMGVDEKIRHPGRVEIKPGLHLGCVGLHKIPVQIQVVGRDTKTHLQGTVLVGTVEWAKVLMAVDIEDWEKQDCDIVEQRGGELMGCNIAQ